MDTGGFLAEIFACIDNKLQEVDIFPVSIRPEMRGLEESLSLLHQKFINEHGDAVDFQDRVNLDSAMQRISERIAQVAPQDQNGGRRQRKRRITRRRR
jgi:hypothetical protein